VDIYRQIKRPTLAKIGMYVDSVCGNNHHALRRVKSELMKTANNLPYKKAELNVVN
jgi:hypothetical protein